MLMRGITPGVKSKKVNKNKSFYHSLESFTDEESAKSP